MNAAANPASGTAASTSPARSVEVRPPSARAEALGVLRVGALILCAAWIYIVDATAPASREASVASSRPPYQKLFRELAAADQRMFRELQEGLLEAENARAASGRWPEVATLAQEGIPPFAADPIATAGTGEIGETGGISGTSAIGARGNGGNGGTGGNDGTGGIEGNGGKGGNDGGGRSGRGGGSYTWTLRREGLVINYLGVPAAAGRPAFLLLAQEPDPLAPPHAPTPPDEEHHRLSDGTMLHVSIWMRAGGPSRRDAVIPVPPAEGWTQLLAGPQSPAQSSALSPGRSSAQPPAQSSAQSSEGGA